LAVPGIASAERTAAAAVAGGEAEALHKKLVWLNLFRLATVTVLLGGTALTTWRSGMDLWEAALPLYSIVLATYLFSLLFAVALRLRRQPKVLAHAHIAADVAIAAGVVAVTGWSDSVFVFMFILGVVNGSILLYRQGAMAAAALAVAAYLVLILGFEPHRAGRLPLTTLFVHGSAFFATAALASYLAEQLRRTGERLLASESDLAAITALHESIVQSVSSGLVTLDGAGRVTFLNRAGEQISGLRAEEVWGRPADLWFSAFEPGDRREVDFANARGEKVRLGYTRFPLLGRGGEEMGTAVIFQDLTEMRAMEARVQRSERLAELGRVAAGLAHELRNPLASISGCVELIRGGGSLGPEEERLMDIVLREAARLDQLVTRFLEFSRPAPPKRKDTDVARVLEETLQVFANDPAAARVRLEPSLRAVVVPCDPDQIRQVFWNLLANAAQAVDGEGGRIQVACAPEGAGAAVTISDDGPGIALADLSRIFEPFFTTKQQGTGLGLATVQRIVDAHGGTIEVASEPGRGATFTVRLPGSGGTPLRAAAG
jgi:two-component system, NtrC family, sensor histidine kinase PilS